MFANDYTIWRERLKNILSEARYQHSLRVSESAGEMAQFWQLDREKALTAGLLHDMAREMPQAEMLAMADCYLGKEAENLKKAPILLHGPIASYLLKEKWGIEDAEILEAVDGHTLARPAMRPLTMIVYLADMLDPIREWEGIKEIREKVFIDLGQAMYIAIKYQIAWLEKHKGFIHPAVYEAYKYYSAN